MTLLRNPPVPAPSAAGRGVAARAVRATKVYGKGDSAVKALDGVDAEFASGAFTAIMGPSGSGKSTLMHCLAGLDELTSGQVLIGDVDLTTPQRQAPHPPAPGQDRLHLPGLQPGADPHRAGEHHPPHGPGRAQAGPGVARPGGRHHRPAPTGSSTGPASCPAASSSGWRWAGPWPGGRRSSSPTSPPATSTAGPGPRSSTSCAGPYGSWARPSSWSPTTRARPATPTGWSSWPTAASSTRSSDPTAEAVLDRMKTFGTVGTCSDCTWKGLWAHKLRFALTGLAVILGVAFMAGTQILTDTMGKTFDGIFEDANQGVDVVVRRGAAVESTFEGEVRERVDTATLDQIRGHRRRRRRRRIDRGPGRPRRARRQGRGRLRLRRRDRRQLGGGRAAEPVHHRHRQRPPGPDRGGHRPEHLRQ